MLKRYSAIVVLCILVLAVYAQVVHHEFLNYDDDVFVTKNQYVVQGFTPRSIAWAFQADLMFDSVSADYWQPVTILSRLFDVQCFGLNPAAHHLMNLLYHLLNVILAFVLIYELTGSFWSAWFCTALFAVHPLQVQTVSWITARKDLLSALFSLCALIVYVKQRKNSYQKTTLICLFMLLGMMSKPSAAALPLLMVFIDEARGVRIKKGIKEKIPYFILASLSFAALWYSRSGVSIDIPREMQFYNVAFNLRHYVSKFFIPIHMSIYSRIPDSELSFLKSVLVYLVCVFISVQLWKSKKRSPFVFLGWFWFLAALAPSVFLTRADRFMYVPLLGLSLALTSLVVGHKKRKLNVYFVTLCFGLTTILAFLAHHECGYWKDNFTLFRRAIQLDDFNYRAHNNLASAYSQIGEDEEAIQHYTTALQINPNYSQAHHNLAVILARKENFHISEFHYLRAIETNPTFALAYSSLGLLYMEVKEYEKAIQAFRHSIQIEPDSEVVHKSLGNALSVVGDLEGSCAEYARALQINPKFAEAHHDWGFVLAKQERYAEAKEHFLAALSIDPDYADVHNKLGVVLAIEGDREGAIEHLKEAIDLNPEDQNAVHNLNLVLNENQTEKIVYEK